MVLLKSESLHVESGSSSFQRRRSLKGESIRSLRGLLETKLSDVAATKRIGTKRDEERGDSTAANTNKTAANDALCKRDSYQMRSRLLHNLGIPKKEPAKKTNAAVSNPVPSNKEPWDETYELPLNDDQGYLPPTANHTLRFYPSVKVIPIPSHKVYSNRIKQTIWSNAFELEDNVTRNSLEFHYEHWDVSQVLDEETGLVYRNGEWIHPVHLGCDSVEQEPVHVLLSEEELWKQTCERLGIQPAEYYHSIIPCRDTCAAESAKVMQPLCRRSFG